MAKRAKEAEFLNKAWGGQAHYQCATCSFDTFNEVVMLNHLVDKHDSERALEQLLSKESEVSDGTSGIDKNNG